MKILQGITASPGIAEGTVCIYKSGSEDIEHYSISRKQVENEIKRLDEAFLNAEKKIKDMKVLSGELFGKQGNDIISAHLSVLKDCGLKKKIEKDIRQNLVNAEHAVEDAFNEYSSRLEGKGNHFEEITHDIADVRDRLIESFKGHTSAFACPVGEKSPVIVASARLTPSMVVNINHSNVLAFVTEKSGITSHAAILARTLNVPVVFDIEVTGKLKCRDRAIVDGSAGKVILNPDEKTLNNYTERIKKDSQLKKLCAITRSEPARTDNGTRIRLKVNLSAMEELELLKSSAGETSPSPSHYDGIGLLRTEFIFMKETSPPTEEYQYGIYKKILKLAGGREVTARMLDLGSDKMPAFINPPDEADSVMELRGAAAVLNYREIYQEQAKALLRAAADGPVKILFPMVSDLDDLYIFKELIKDAAKKLKNSGASYRVPPEGIMFETPSSALLANQFFSEIDFANIGTNDLLQYLVASSRTSKTKGRNYHILHPSVVKMLQLISDASAKAGKEACLCGEVAGFEIYYPVLLDAGIRSFSVPAAKFEEIKCGLQHLDIDKYRGMTEQYLNRKTLKLQTSFFETA